MDLGCVPDNSARTLSEVQSGERYEKRLVRDAHALAFCQEQEGVPIAAPGNRDNAPSGAPAEDDMPGDYIGGDLRPEWLVSVHWTRSLERRFVVVARQHSADSYEVHGWHRSLSAGALLETLRRLGGNERLLVGLDVPLGIPIAYGRLIAVSGFADLLSRTRRDPHFASFLEPSDRPSIAQPFGPVTEEAKLDHKGLAEALNLAMDELLRRCDLKTKDRGQLPPLFYTRYAEGRDVDPPSMWREVVIPALDAGARLWPFDGELDGLVVAPSLVLAETNVSEALTHLALPVKETDLRGGRGRSEAWPRLREALGDSGLEGVDSFAGDADCLESLAALVALASMVQVVSGRRAVSVGVRGDLRATEGWILGQDAARMGAPRRARGLVSLTGEKVAGEPYFIERVICGPDPKTGVMVLDKPSKVGGRHGYEGGLNVICGTNNSGKSYILKEIRKALTGSPTSVRVEPQPPPGLLPLDLLKMYQTKDKVGHVNLEQIGNKLYGTPGLGDSKRAGLKFLARQISAHIPEIGQERPAERLREEAVRARLTAQFPSERQIFACDPNDPLVSEIEEVLDGTLFFRRARQGGNEYLFEFVLRYADDSTVPFDEWSDGQRAFFCFVLSLEHLRPSIVLVDEIENHLHPAYISHVLSAIGRSGAQGIAASHHPHLIFSERTNRVFFIDTTPRGRHVSSESAVPYAKPVLTKLLPRRVLQLTDDFEKVTNAYKLFDLQDSRLLAQARYVAGRTTVALLDAVRAAFRPAQPLPPQDRPTADRQTIQLAEQIRVRLIKTRRPRVLDLGAGVGRQVQEMAKVRSEVLDGGIDWTLFEIFPENWQDLERLAGRNLSVRVAREPTQLGEHCYDLCLMANVLHELTPPEAADYLRWADRCLDHAAGGTLVILDLFPLPHPERYAVPYDPTDLIQVLSGVGYATTHTEFTWGGPPRATGTAGGSARGYAVVARRGDTSKAVSSDAAAVIEAEWGRILTRCLSNYAFGPGAAGLDKYQEMLSVATTAVSIVSWREGHWRPRTSDLRLLSAGPAPR